MAFIVLSCPLASAQKAEITPYIGYRFGGSFTNRAQDVSFDVQNSASFGAIFDYKLYDFMLVEFHWSHQGSTLELSRDEQALETSISIDNFHGGVLFQGGSRDLQPFFLASLGATRFGFNEGSSTTNFSLGVGVGMKGLVTDRLGWRVEFRGFTTFTNIEDEYEVCDVWGCATVTNTSTIFWQSQVLGGLVIAF
jgi:hypothetical protein